MYADVCCQPSPIKSSGIPKLAVSPVKSRLPVSKPVTRTSSASTHSLSSSTGHLGAPVQSDDNPPNTPASPSTPSKSPASRKSVGGTHRLYSPNAKESKASTGIPSYAQPTFANSTRLPYAGTSFASTASAATSIPAPKSILKKQPASPRGVSSKAAAVTQRLTSTQPLPPSPRNRAPVAAAAAKAQQPAGKHAKQASLGLSSTNSRIPAFGSASGSKTGSTRASAQTSARTSRQGSAGSAAAVPASPVLASILAQAQAAQAQVAEVQEEEAEQTAPRRSLGVHSRGHSRGASNVSNLSVTSGGSVLSPRSGENTDLLDEHDLLDDIDDVDTSFDDVASAPTHAEQPLDESQQDTEEQQLQQLDDEEAGDDFAATDNAFDIEPVADNNLVETPLKPAEHEEKTQDIVHTSAEAVAEAAARDEQGSKQTVIITAPQSAAQERRPSNVHELSATSTPQQEEEKEQVSAHKEASKPAAQPALEAQVVSADGGNMLMLDSNNAVTINAGNSAGIGVRRVSLSQGSDAAPVTLDLVIGATTDAQAEQEEYEEDEYEEEDGDEEGPAQPIVLSLNITIGSNGQVLQQSVQPVTHATPAVDVQQPAQIELITDEQAEADKQQEAAELEEAQPAQQTAQFTTIIIDRDTTSGGFENSASPFTRTPATTVTEQPRPQTEEEAPMDTSLLPTRTPAPSTAVPADAAALHAASIVIESPATAVPSTLTYFDTLTTSRDQPSVSTLEPVIRAPAPSTALPADSAVPVVVVKSVAFSDEVTALGEGKEETSESLDFGDDLSLPTTPLRGSVIDYTAASATGGSSLQPIASSAAVAQADNATAAAAGVAKLKEVEAERRAEEDRRKADEADAKRQSADSERATEAAQAEQKAAAEDKVREQLAESKRALFAQMREGVPVTKLGKKGSPRDTRIFITEAEGAEGQYTINWDSKSKKPEDARLPLQDCRCVVGGDEGMFVHRKYAGKYDGCKERCVSVVSAVRGLDVVLADEEAVNRLVAMLRLCGCPVRET